jgi:hypothetical protein
MCVNVIQPLLLLLLLPPNVVRLPSLERGDEEGYGSAWGGVYLVMGDIISWTPIESRTVHACQDMCIFVKYFKG